MCDRHRQICNELFLLLLTANFIPTNSGKGHPSQCHVLAITELGFGLHETFGDAVTLMLNVHVRLGRHWTSETWSKQLHLYSQDAAETRGTGQTRKQNRCPVSAQVSDPWLHLSSTPDSDFHQNQDDWQRLPFYGPPSLYRVLHSPCKRQARIYENDYLCTGAAEGMTLFWTNKLLPYT